MFYICGMARNKVYLGTPFDIVPVNVYDIKNRQIIFTGSQKAAAKFIGTTPKNICSALNRITNG